MENTGTPDTMFQEAVSAIDAGNVEKLEQMLDTNPGLVSERLESPGSWLRNTVGSALDGYFKYPYLLWFIADNPIRTDQMPSNIDVMTSVIIRAIQSEAPESLQQQLDYTLGLVATGRIPPDCRVQIRLMDLLIDAGARPGGGIGALAHGNLAAAEHLINRGGKVTLAVAACLDRMGDVNHLAQKASAAELQVALAAAAFYGKAPMLTLLIAMGADINAFPEESTGFHSHATPLHQAVSSGSPGAVKVLVEAGANPAIKDLIYNGTPLGWAEYMQAEETDENAKKNFATIIDYLRNRE
jgi:hypothetical protein